MEMGNGYVKSSGPLISAEEFLNGTPTVFWDETLKERCLESVRENRESSPYLVALTKTKIVEENFYINFFLHSEMWSCLVQWVFGILEIDFINLDV